MKNAINPVMQNICQRCSNGAMLHSLCADLTRAEFESLVTQFVVTSAQHMSSRKWLAPATERRQELMKGDPTVFKLVGDYEISSLFVPFVRKKIVTAHCHPGVGRDPFLFSESNGKIVVIGDLHGDCQALQAIFTELEAQGYIDRAWHVRSDCTLVFLGDYSNRGDASVPVIAALMHLFIHNPDNVVLLRGNHEYALTNKLFNQRHAVKNETEGEHLGSTSLLGELKQRFEGYTYPDLLGWYDYLPQALFIGWDDAASGKKQFIQFCHGGIEIGYCPHDLLHAVDDVEYEELVTFDRGTVLRALVDGNVLGVNVAQRVSDVLAFIQKAATNGFESLYTTGAAIDFRRLQSSYHLRFGLQWNNFLSEANDAIMFAASPKRKNLIFGSLLTKYFMQQASSDSVQLCSIVRAHQHLNEVIQEIGLKGTMLDDTRSGKGLVWQWGGLVATLGASSEISGYQSFITLDCANKALHHYYKRPADKNFSATDMFFRSFCAVCFSSPE